MFILNVTLYFCLFVCFLGASVPLQMLLNHTLQRLLASIEVPPGIIKLELHCKWGADGSSGHSEYDQTPVTKESESMYSDADLFLITLVPISLYSLEEEKKTMVWENPRPSSTRFCRPLKLLYQKESKELVVAEIEKIQKEIKELIPLEICLDDRVLQCTFILHLTMVNICLICFFLFLCFRKCNHIFSLGGWKDHCFSNRWDVPELLHLWLQTN